MKKYQWICKDSNCCEFLATLLIDNNGFANIKPSRRYIAFGGKVLAYSLKELKEKVGQL